MMEGRITYPDGKEAAAGLDWLIDHWLNVVMVEVTKGGSSKRPAVLTARLDDRTLFEYPFATTEECLAWIENHRDRFFGVRLRIFGVDTRA